MKTPSRYILAAEILIVALFHTAKIKQAEKQPPVQAFTQAQPAKTSPKPLARHNSAVEYMLLNVIK